MNVERPTQIPEQVWSIMPALPFEYEGICAILPLPRFVLDRLCPILHPIPPPPPPPPSLANVYGRVVDSATKQPLPGVAVQLNGFSGTTDATGGYLITDVEPGPYTITFSLAGYKQVSQSVQVNEGNNNLNAELTPIEVIPPPSVYKVNVTFQREMVCATSRGSECLEWASDERKGVVTVVNQGAPGQFTIILDGWIYSGETQLSKLTHGEWIGYFEVAQTRTYSRTYGIPITGEPVHSRFFVKVYDPSGAIIADVVFVTSL